MNEMVPGAFTGVVPAHLQNAASVNDDLAGGVQAGFGLITYKGKVWTIKYRGDERQLLRDDGDGPRNSLELVIVKSSPHISKIWYEAGYVEGSTSAPDCFSANGIVPDISSVKKQAASCAACPKNAWGSRITPQGKQGKACSDAKRLAVVPMGDIANETFGGPMLLRVPAASLQDMAMFAKTMQKQGYPYNGIATRIAFDPAEAYPKFVFTAIRPLSAEEYALVVEHMNSVRTEQILAESVEMEPAAEVAAPIPFEQTVTPGVTPAFTPPAQAAPVQAAPVAATPPAAPVAATPPAAQATAGGFGPTTGPASTQSAPTAAAPASNPATAAQPNTPTPSVQSEPATQPSDGGAEPAGSTSPAVSASTTDDFTASLDAQLAALLPATA
jgi:hypothetical protein